MKLNCSYYIQNINRQANKKFFRTKKINEKHVLIALKITEFLASFHRPEF
jgi:hypothetical protein